MDQQDKSGPGFTKGPWNAVEHYSDEVSVVDQGGYEVVSAESIAILLGYPEKLGIQHWADDKRASRELSPEEQAANARLIAAAPELYEACAAMIEWDDAEKNAKPYADDGGKAWRERLELCASAFDKARAALAKATGSQQ